MNIRSAIINWLGGPISTTDDRLYHTHEHAGVSVTDHTVLSLSAVWACVRLLSSTISTLPLRVYRDDGDGRKVIDSQYPLDRTIHRRPSQDSTAVTFWQAVVASILLRGGAYIEVTRVGPMPVSIVFLPLTRLQVSERAGKREYRYINDDGSTRVIPNSRVVYIPGLTLDGKTGISAIQYGAATFGSALAASTAANKTFENGLQPTTYIKHPTVVTKEQREQFRAHMNGITGAVNAGKTVVLEGGQDIGTIGINARDAQLLESRSFSVEEICRWFNVPAYMIGHTAGTTTWGTGMEQMNLAFLTYTLRPLLNIIEQAVHKDLIPVADQGRYTVEYNIEALLRADSAGRANFYSQMVNNGLMTRDEVRRKENLEPMGGNASVLTVQTALTPIDQLGTVANEN